MNQVVKWARGQIVVRQATVGDEIASGAIRRNLTDYVREVVAKSDPAATWGQWEPFANFCAQTESSTGLGFQAEIVRGLTGEALYAAYQKYLCIPIALRDKWAKACEAANMVTDIELGPLPLGEQASPEA